MNVLRHGLHIVALAGPVVDFRQQHYGNGFVHGFFHRVGCGKFQLIALTKEAGKPVGDI